VTRPVRDLPRFCVYFKYPASSYGWAFSQEGPAYYSTLEHAVLVAHRFQERGLDAIVEDKNESPVYQVKGRVST
jgi:hypothetical protein